MMNTRIPKYVVRCCVCIIATLGLPGLALSADDTVQVVQSSGADQNVHYESLQKFGPWDDRNYQLTANDLTYLAKNESELHPQIPAFFRVELRKEWPSLRKTGAAQYPRAARQLFEIRYGGLMQNGVIARDRRALARTPVPVGSEVQLNTILGANEVTVEINPSNPLQVVAGSNNAGGQEMYYSTDGGTNWTIQGVLPDTCCDPTVDWSSDGTVAYAAALSGAIGVSTWRSFDGGQNWVDRVNLTSSGSDKEWVHVDKSLISPHVDNVYLTYHNSNTMQFARSTDMGASYTITALNSAPSGIGSDITTTSNGDVYYAYGAFGAQTIELLKSTDGGLTFGPSQSIASTNGAFDFPIPSMETRRAWIYATIDADRGGAFDGSVYVSWTDTVDPENNGSASANHTRIYVAYSRDGGATWALSTPHSTSDMDTVDRWNQWMTVDASGVVHVVYYDTRHSVGRTGVDLYYTFSTDGGVNWKEDQRISSVTSQNLTDGQEFGDYNGISVVGEKIITTWTDNRDGPPNNKDVFAAEALNIAAEPGFTLAATPASQALCVPGDLNDITVSVGSIQDFSNPVALSLSGLPAGFTGGFSTNPVTPTSPSTPTTATISVGTVASGDYSFSIDGTALDGTDRSTTINVSAFAAAPASSTLIAPGDNAIDQATSPELIWNPVAGATSYIVELDDDFGFGSIDFSATTDQTSATASGLSTETLYFWRVRAINPCGEGANSIISNFTTGLVLCATGPVSIPDNGGPADPASLDLATANSGSISDLNISINVTHTYVGDLIATLEHVDTGTTVTLIDRPGRPDGGTGFGCSNSDIDTLMDDEATLPVEDQCAPGVALAGSLIPQFPLSAFDGEDIGGTWTLSVSDNAGADVGTLNEWCLLPTTAGGDPDTDGDGIADSIDNCTDKANADQRDTNGDGFGNACDADINNDCIVNFPDSAAYSANFFQAGDLDTDNNGDGITNFPDLAVLSTQFFGPPGPSGIASCVE